METDPRRDVIITGIGGQGIQLCAKVLALAAAAVPTVEELRAHVASRLVAAKHPRVVVAVEQLPHTDATGQIRRAALRAEIMADGSHEPG